MRTSIFRSLVVALLALALLPGIASGSDDLAFGVFPFNTPLTLIRTHQPLRDHLTQEVGRELRLFTSVDYRAFLDSLNKGEFALTIVPPHFAIYARDQGYVPLVTYRAELEFVLIESSSAAPQRPLRGARIGVPDRLTIAAIAGLHWLEERGLQPARDFELREFSNHGAAAAAVALGTVHAAVVASTALRQTPADVQAAVRVRETIGRFPHLITMVRGDLPPADQGAIQAALLSFGSTAAGSTFFQSTGYQGYRSISLEALAPLDPYWHVAQRQMSD